MIKILLKKQFLEMFKSFFYNQTTNEKRSAGSVALYISLFVFSTVIVLGGMFTALALLLCSSLAAMDLSWLYFALFSIIAILIGIFGSVFNTYSGLYLSKDNDLLLSMPIPVHAIMISRLLGVYLMGLMFSGIVILPAVAVYSFLISLIVLILSCLLGWVIAKISLKLKNKSFITVIISLAFIAAYYFVYFKAQTIIKNFLENAVTYGEKIMSDVYPLYMFGKIGTGDILSILIFTAAILLLFAVMWFVLSRSFIKISTSSAASANSKSGALRKKSAARQNSISKALLKKEFARFTSSPNYMLNCGLASFLIPILGIFLIIKKADISYAFNTLFVNSAGLKTAVICIALCLLATMNDSAAPSVSLEGKSIWILQSLPIDPKLPLIAKLLVQILVTAVPLVFCSACAAFAFSADAVSILFMIIIPIIFALLSSCFGLFIGLKMPNLNWTSEITPIKQNIGVLIAIFGGVLFIGFMFVFCLILVNIIGMAACLSVVAVIMLALSYLLLHWITTKGANIFKNL